MPIVFIYIIIIPYIHEFVKMDAWPLDAASDEVCQKFRCKTFLTKGNNTFQIVWRDNSDVGLDGAGLRLKQLSKGKMAILR